MSPAGAFAQIKALLVGAYASCTPDYEWQLKVQAEGAVEKLRGYLA